MWIYLFRKFNLLVITLFLLTLLSFWLQHLVPGGPLVALNPQALLSDQEQQELIQQFALDRGFWMQYWHYLVNILQGQWAVSHVEQVPIQQYMMTSFFATLQLALSALILAIFIGIPLGIISAMKPQSLLDRIIVSFNLIGQSIPVFWWALMLILIFALGVNWFPISGRLDLLFDIPDDTGVLLFDIFLADGVNQQAAFINALHHMVLPTLAISVIPITLLSQNTRDSLIDIFDQNYIEAARAKGLTRWQVLYRHALPNYFSSFIRQVGALANPLLTGTMIVEVIFSWPGAGRWLVNSLMTQNIAAIQACMLTISTFVILLSIITDLLAVVSNPAERNLPNG